MITKLFIIVPRQKQISPTDLYNSLVQDSFQLQEEEGKNLGKTPFKTKDKKVQWKTWLEPQNGPKEKKN